MFNNFDYGLNFRFLSNYEHILFDFFLFLSLFLSSECDQLTEQIPQPWDQVDKNGFAMLASIEIYEKTYANLPYTSPSFNFSVRLPTDSECFTFNGFFLSNPLLLILFCLFIN